MDSEVLIHSTTRNFKLSVLSNRALGILVLLLLALGGCRSVWLSVDNIDTDDFESIRSALEPDIQEIMNRARKQAERGSLSYRMNDLGAQQRYGVISVQVEHFEGEDGALYEVLFVFTSVVRGFGGGYYYTPSGKLPSGAPNYGVVCSKQVGDFWYAFRTVDSQEPPDRKDCPEDTQYQR
jgi:hypothetical protein